MNNATPLERLQIEAACWREAIHFMSASARATVEQRVASGKTGLPFCPVHGGCSKTPPCKWPCDDLRAVDEALPADKDLM